MKISLKTPMFLNGHRYSSGDVVDLPPGMVGPYAGDRPLFDVVDEESWSERQELNARHAKERAELHPAVTEDEELVRKQAVESAELSRKHKEKGLHASHVRQKDELAAKQKAEKQLLEHRPPANVVPPPETNLPDLDRRHKAEADALAARQEAEANALVAVEVADEPQEAAQPPKAPPPVFEPKYAD